MVAARPYMKLRRASLPKSWPLSPSTAAVQAGHVHHQLLDRLLHFAALDLQQRTFGARALALGGFEQRAQFHRLQRHQLDLDVGQARAGTAGRRAAACRAGSRAGPARAAGGCGAWSRRRRRWRCARAPAATWRRSSPCPARRSRLATGTRTSSKKTSFRLCSPSIEMIGLMRMPGVFMSMSRKLMPSCRRAEASVRTRQNIQSACCA